MNYSGLSCEDVYINNVATRDKSGYYRINNNEWVYCNMRDMISSCAVLAWMVAIWKRIASFNITAGDDCPSPWVKSSHNSVNFCIGSTAAGCYSLNYRIEQNFGEFGESPQFAKFFSPTFPMKHENAGKPWIRQSFFRQCFKITISPKFFTAKVLFYTVFN